MEDYSFQIVFNKFKIHINLSIFFSSCLYFKGTSNLGVVVACAYKAPTVYDSCTLEMKLHFVVRTLVWE